MSKKASLAVDRMSTSALWTQLMADLFRLDQGLLGGLPSRERAQRTSRALRIARELCRRGVQTTLC